MAKLIKILVASVGGGLVLGAGIRLGEAIAAQLPAPGRDGRNKLEERLDELENRLVTLAAEVPAASGISAVHSQLVPESGPYEAAAETSLRLRGELRDWLEESVTARMAEVETRLRDESELGQKRMLDAFAESVQTRVIQRISRLEEEVASQSAAMGELRECSLRTERSVHKLLGGLDKLIVKNLPVVEEAVSESSPAPPRVPNVAPAERAVVDPPSFEQRPKSRRWKIFG